jgi:toxin YhaV
MDVQVVNGFELHALSIFQECLDSLISEVEAISRTDETLYEHPLYKLLDCVGFAIYNYVPQDPQSRDFNLGTTLDKSKHRKFTSWKRVKKHMPARYRLFFRFNTQQPKTIVYAWLNNEQTIRKADAKTDVYAVFTRMLQNGTIPDDWAALIIKSNALQDTA